MPQADPNQPVSVWEKYADDPTRPEEEPKDGPRDLTFLKDYAPYFYMSAAGYLCSCCFCLAPPLAQLGLGM